MHSVSLIRIIRDSRFSALLLALTMGCSETGESCTLIGCSDGFSIHMVANEPLRGGTYDVVLTLDGVPVTCQHIIAANQPAAIPTCSNGPIRSSVSIHNGGAAPNQDVPNAITVVLVGTPAVAVLEVRHDGALVAEQSYEPSYETITPNGPECGPICDVAQSQQVTLSFN